MKSVWKVAFVLAAVAMVISGGGVEATVSCFTEFIPCLPFAANNAPQPKEGCCNGLRKLEGKAKSSEQRRQLCDCIQSIATAGGGVLNWGKAAKLPSICRVDLGFPLNPSLNCALF